MHQITIKPTIVVVVDVVAASFIIVTTPRTYHQC
jgi:hypothetical protein